MARRFNHKATTALITASALLFTGCQNAGLGKDRQHDGRRARGRCPGGAGRLFPGNALGGAVTTAVVTLAGAAAGAWLGTQIAAQLELRRITEESRAIGSR